MPLAYLSKPCHDTGHHFLACRRSRTQRTRSCCFRERRRRRFRRHRYRRRLVVLDELELVGIRVLVGLLLGVELAEERATSRVLQALDNDETGALVSRANGQPDMRSWKFVKVQGYVP